MNYKIILLLILISFQLSAKKAPEWKEGNFMSTSSGLQYKIEKWGRGALVLDDDVVTADLYEYDAKSHLKTDTVQDKKKTVSIIGMDDPNILKGVIESVHLLKKGGRGYFKIPPLLTGNKYADTIFCFIVVHEIFHKQPKSINITTPADTTVKDSVNTIVIKDPNKKYFGDTLFSLMKLVEQPQIVSCGTIKVIMAFKFEMTSYNNGIQHKDILVFIECPDFYGKDYFVAGANYMITCIPLYDDLKNGSRTMNSYSLEKLDRYYGLRVRKM